MYSSSKSLCFIRQLFIKTTNFLSPLKITQKNPTVLRSRRACLSCAYVEILLLIRLGIDRFVGIFFAGPLQISHKSIAKVTMINFKFLKLSKTCKWRLRQILLLAPVICRGPLVEHINNSESTANYNFLNDTYRTRKYAVILFHGRTQML